MPLILDEATLFTLTQTAVILPFLVTKLKAGGGFSQWSVFEATGRCLSSVCGFKAVQP